MKWIRKGKDNNPCRREEETLFLSLRKKGIMELYTPSREQAWQLLNRFNRNENLIRHALTVEAVMRHFAGIYHEDVEKWGIIGLIHDLDYEKYPEQHCVMTKKILEDENWPADYIRSVVSHGWGICSDVEPEHIMEKVLFAVDELTGLVTASVLVRPTKSILDMEARSVRKKWSIKHFAAGANREVIEKGAVMMGKDLDFVIEETIRGMRKVAGAIGLQGLMPGADDASRDNIGNGIVPGIDEEKLH
jgi:predicted hydrolase (HD superfamily)